MPLGKHLVRFLDGELINVKAVKEIEDSPE
jgi:hypothetical protein